MKMLIVEDDIRIAQPLKTHLEHQQHQVELALDGERGLELALQTPFDFILLDLMLPKLDGLTICHSLRNAGCNSAILMLTARDRTADKITGLECGADDYLVKPFDLDEVTARIQAIRRRGRDLKQPVLQIDDFQLDQNTCLTTYKGQIINFTSTEYRLLSLFFNNPGRVFRKEEIIDRLWGRGADVNDDIVKTHIKGVRSKLKGLGAPRDLVQTVHGLGYKLKAQN